MSTPMFPRDSENFPKPTPEQIARSIARVNTGSETRLLKDAVVSTTMLIDQPGLEKDEAMAEHLYGSILDSMIVVIRMQREGPHDSPYLKQINTLIESSASIHETLRYISKEMDKHDANHG